MTFSRVPMPRVEWEERSMRYILAAFPLVGIVVAAFSALWVAFASFMGFGFLVVAAGLLAVPLIVTGGIHLDGYSDVCDALSSHAEADRKCQILKDPHVGAFGVMAVGLYMVLYLAVCSDIPFTGAELLCLCATYPLERCLSGLLCLLNDKNSSDGMVSMFKRSASQRSCIVILMLQACVYAGVMMCADAVLGAVLVAVAVVCWFIVRRIAKRQFGGVNGDLAGFFLQVCELAALMAILVVGKVVAL